ncbi:MAG: hypothetical protein HY075_14235 [Deltaproteobacteria bacterium]|nr:hypothetical protein [Deltaproteobacteria bacterium]
MKKISILLSMAGLLTLATAQPASAWSLWGKDEKAPALAKRPSGKKAATSSATRQSGVLKNTAPARSESAGLGSESESSVLGKDEFSAQTGAAFLSDFTGMLFSLKGSRRVISAPLFAEVGVSTAFSGKMVAVPVDAGARYDFNVRGVPQAKVYPHVSLGPSFNTKGSVVTFHLFTGAGMLYRFGHNVDGRLDLGLVLFGSAAGFQAAAGVAL